MLRGTDKAIEILKDVVIRLDNLPFPSAVVQQVSEQLKEALQALLDEARP